MHLIKLFYTYKAKTKKKMIRMFEYYFHDLSPEESITAGCVFSSSPLHEVPLALLTH